MNRIYGIIIAVLSLGSQIQAMEQNQSPWYSRWYNQRQAVPTYGTPEQQQGYRRAYESLYQPSAYGTSEQQGEYRSKVYGYAPKNTQQELLKEMGKLRAEVNNLRREIKEQKNYEARMLYVGDIAFSAPQPQEEALYNARKKARDAKKAKKQVEKKYFDLGPEFQWRRNMDQEAQNPLFGSSSESNNQ